MPTIDHLLDDSAIGGVNRMLADQTGVLKAQFDIRHHLVKPRHPLPPRVDGDVAVVHFTPSWSKLPFLTLLKAQRGDKPVIIVEHTFTRNFEQYCVPSRGRFRRMLRLAYRLADAVVAVSHGQAAWMREAELLPNDKLFIIPPAVDYQALMQIPTPVRDRSRPLRLAAYGRYCQQKGFDVLIDAMRRLPAESVTLTLAGYGPDEQALRDRAAGMPNVTVGGPIDDLGRFLTMHDAIVVPSRWEAFGLVALEARAAARPIVVCDVDGLSEQVAERHGFGIRAESAEQLAQGIQELEGCNLKVMGRCSRQSVEYSFRDHVHSWGSLMHRHAAPEANIRQPAFCLNNTALDKPGIN